MSIVVDAERLAEVGAPRPIQLPATRYLQGGRTMFHITLTLAQLPQLVSKRPDPNEPIEGNRRVDPGRARKFGEYVLAKDDWVSPAIIVRAPSAEVDFEAIHPFEDGTAWGILKIPLHVLTEILLLDGQHRTLGTFIAIDEINQRIRKMRDAVDKAIADENQPVVAEMQAALRKLQHQRDKLSREHIAVDLALVSTDQGKQMFVDIANNARGVSRDFTTVLDQRDVINRIAVELIENHALLIDRVELGQSNRMSASNPHFVGAKTVADVVRAVLVGVSGRVGVRIEDELSRNLPAAVASVETFLDMLVAGFPELGEMIDGEIDPIELRSEQSGRRSMIASATMLRALAGAYHDLTKKPIGAGEPRALKRSEVEVFFAALAPKLRTIPIADTDTFWMRTGAFVPGTSAPQARQGSITALVRYLVGWARKGDDGLDLDPALEATDHDNTDEVAWQAVDAPRATTSAARAAAASGEWRPGGAPSEMYEVLKAAGEPLHVKEITKRVLERGNAQLQGKTPEATLASTLGMEILKPQPKFKRVGPSTFTIA
jgi:DGQHR domain-containing protein